MRMLLINQNPIVSKLVALSAQKAGLEIDEEVSLDALEGSGFDVVFVDDAKAEGMDPDAIKARTGARKVCLIYAGDDESAEAFECRIKKPFLPTELVDVLTELAAELEMPETVEEADESVNERNEEGTDVSDEGFDALLEAFEK
jgi:uncharacterized membrane protein